MNQRSVEDCLQSKTKYKQQTEGVSIGGTPVTEETRTSSVRSGRGHSQTDVTRKLRLNYLLLIYLSFDILVLVRLRID